MIKFFRGIRQNLLAENKFNKYLLYAIGEIFLVVIGILIALQLNNWNSERITNHKRVSYLENLAEDLKIDTLNFYYRIKFYQELIDKKSYLMSLTQYENIPIDSIQNLIMPQYGSYQFNTSAFTKITNQGISELSANDSLSLKIYNYYTTEMEDFNTVIQWEVESTNKKQRVLDIYLNVKKYADGLIKEIEDELLTNTG